MLEIKNLTIGYATAGGVVKAVKEVNFSVKPGQIVGLVGESGCGKSTALFSIMGLIKSPGKIMDGEIVYNGHNLASQTPDQWRSIRGKEIAMIFQDPMTTLNPAFRVGKQIHEVLQTHRVIEPEKKGWLERFKLRHKEKERVLTLMREVGISAPEQRYEAYPHQFSGGMQQRILIAMGLACNPKLLLADEPTTALDVTIQAQILDLLKRINKEHGTSMIIVTHDLGMAAEFCHEVAVMYAGQIVERGPTELLIANPKHPYTKGLLQSIPRITKTRQRIEPIPGTVVDLAKLGDECAFRARCSYASDDCSNAVTMTQISEEHQVRCVLYERGSEASGIQQAAAHF
ncbi:ABC transporter ATP-binding protein [Paenibacillus radicis (ex Xue et al. 2023)]|uniref:ABC transporter ATP-binding protein n=1 Tax=Paenibacillus radicis (ex Xue et al. 2023) TaxID=2972489 RepID=A0ABT1YL78_9BACL|nr:ABC transporter ATP-binding protein [Paenibacillus radicis (ex Xue et al. 2023)]MCR8632715.1 ABC transporter ATP-binding protein [Paenibacillus radicis (ex Xue et al. 2023)]